jgi:hypothetical protein
VHDKARTVIVKTLKTKKMESDQTSLREQSAQPIQPTGQEPGQPEKTAEHEPVLSLYSAAEAEHIASLLCHTFNAEYILLFGSLVGRTPHSDIAAYDLLIVSGEEPYYGADSPRRLLKLKMPPKHRSIGYINPLLYTPDFIINHPSPVFYLAQSEGTMLYCDKHCRPKKPASFNFDTAHCEASRYFGTFFNLGDKILDDANSALMLKNARLAAFYSAQAAMLFLRTLFFVFHCFETDCDDPEILYNRMRTLCCELMLLLDGDHYTAPNVIPRLRKYLREARDSSRFGVSERTVETDVNYVEKMKGIIGKACQRRITLYDLRRKQ